MKRANALRYKEYLGMAKKVRQVIRELIEGPKVIEPLAGKFSQSEGSKTRER